MDIPEPIADLALMRRVRDGDESAFADLHERYQRKVLNFFYGVCHDSAMSNDLCQETFLRVWKIRKRYKATGSFAAYLFGIARMVWLERQRQWWKEARLGIRHPLEDCCAAAQTESPGMSAERNELDGVIQNALAELPEEQRMVFVLRTIKGLSLEDIASALDCPLNTVRSRKILAVKKLRHLLETVFACPADRSV
jgi:RNA polymerase sigma-70 factor, ECF subfamily